MKMNAAITCIVSIFFFRCPSISSFNPNPNPFGIFNVASTISSGGCAFYKRTHQLTRKKTVTPISFSTVNAGENDLSVTTVRFRASKNACTAPLPMPPPTKKIDDFFILNEHRNIMFAQGAGVREVANPSERLMDLLWREFEMRRVKCQMPPRDETAITSIIEVSNPSMQFLSIKLISVVTVGVLLLLGHNKDGTIIQSRPFIECPEFQFTLLDSYFKAEGPRPLVWLFNQITGERQESKDFGKLSQSENSGSQIRAGGFTRIRAKATGDGRVIFCIEALIESDLRIPGLLVRLLPMSVEKMEENGSATLQKAIEKDIAPAMERFGQAYLDWVSVNNVRT